jgi:hypothetical protein
MHQLQDRQTSGISTASVAFGVDTSRCENISQASSTSFSVKPTFSVGNPQYSQEVIKNINYVLGPSSREILFYLRVDSEDGSIEFM